MLVLHDPWSKLPLMGLYGALVKGRLGPTRLYVKSFDQSSHECFSLELNRRIRIEKGDKEEEEEEEDVAIQGSFFVMYLV